MKICFLDAKTMGCDIDLGVFHKLGEFVLYETSSREEAMNRIKNADILINNKVILDEDLLLENKELKMVSLTSTGTNVVDLAYAEKNNIAVTNVSGYSTKNVAQHTFALVLSLLAHLREYDDYVKSGDYAKSGLFTHYGKQVTELDGKTWGIIGLGEIGRETAKISACFGCNIVYYSTSGKNQNSYYKRVSFDELLSVSDIVSVHAPLNEKTKNLLNYEAISKMKKNALLINVGRGGIINEADLARALNEDLIQGAGMDVFEYEPIRQDNPLLSIDDMSKIIMTPHIAWAAIEARRRLFNEVYLNIEAFINGKMRNRVI